MRRVLIWAAALVSLAAMPIFAADSAKDLEWMQKVPHNFLTPDYFSVQPKPLAALPDTINVRINSDNSGQIQNEQQLCINPTNANNVVAVWRDFRYGYRRVGVGYSFDGGLSWTDNIFPVTGRPWHSDPGLAYDINGNFYAVVLAYEPDQSLSGFEVFKSANGGVSWGIPTLALDGVPNVFEDKELIACDHVSGSPYLGNLYIAWTRFWNTDIHIIRSTNGNQTWSAPLMISDVGSVQWPVPVVGANGVVYVAWVSYNNQIKLDRSTNGGVTWGTDITVTNVYTASTYINGSIWVFSFPAMDADISGGPYNGNLYVAYMDRTSTDFDIYFRKSTNQGVTWGSRVRINDDALNNGRDQFHPWLTVDENGVITAMFYDRRLDPGNLRYDIYLTTSADGGATWSANQRITTVSSDPTSLPLAGLIGEYSGLSTRNGIANLAWTDFRLGDQDTYGSRVEIYTTTDLSINMIPNNPPINVPRGGTFTYTGILTNNTNLSKVTDVWIMLNVPGYGMFGPVMQLNNISIGPNQTLSTGVSQSVPGYAPVGNYTYIAYCGDYPSVKTDSSWFNFTVIGPLQNDDNNWSLSSWFGNANANLSTTLSLSANYPNPFNAETTINYLLPTDSHTKLEIYNVLGEKVATLVDEQQTAGEKSITWDATNYSSGVYFYKLMVGETSTTKRMMLLK